VSIGPPTLPELKGIPKYDDAALYLNFGDRAIPWVFDGWKPESLSWKSGCYIHAGLSGTQLDFEGPGAEAFFISQCTNSFAHFPVGSMKHAVMCTEDGLIAAHAILQRHGDAGFRLFASGLPWAEYQAGRSPHAVRVARRPGYLHQVAGPRSLEVFERATGESLKDITFLRFRASRIGARVVEVARIGMAGTLAYEVRGPLEKGPKVYDALYRAGSGLGMQRLGWRAYFVNHVEGGFPQSGWTFFTAAIADAGFVRHYGGRLPRLTDSVSPQDLRARFRTPLEVGWGRSVRFDHDFIGRQALEAEAANPRRTIASLRWNPEDVIDIYASLLRPGEEHKSIDMPITPSWHTGLFAHADHIVKDGCPVGISSGTIYSYHFREVLSLATLDLALANVGMEVEVLWGDRGRRLKTIRAVVDRFPYLIEGRNDRIDTSNV
jgi:vanillate/3-O-methylgallate O-demethylase